MIDLFDLYNRFCSDNNTFQGGLFRPERDFERAVNSISQDLHVEYTNQAEKTQKITDELSVFLKSANIITSAFQNYVLISYPKDYGAYSSARILVHKDSTIEDTSMNTYDNGELTYDCTKETEDQKQKRIELYKDGIAEQPIYKIENSKFGSLLTHRTKAPSFSNPAMTQYENGFKIAPRQISVVVLDYYVKPKYAKFIYDIATGNPQTGSGDYIIYNQNLSGKLEWRESMIPEFLKRLSEVYSKYTRDGLLFQMNKAS
jgi:hypothetical protein